METRNIIRSGTSFVVSIPSEWARENDLDKGDFLYVDVKPDALTYTASLPEEKPTEKIIPVDGVSDAKVEKLINSAYIRNYHFISLKGSSVTKRYSAFRNMFQKLVAVEIMEHSSGLVRAQEMLDREKNRPESIIRRMDMIVRAMFSYLQEGSSKSIHHVDIDMNRMYMLGQRVLNARRQDEERFEVLLAFKTMGILEMIADDLKELDLFVQQPKSEYIYLFKKIKKRYEDIMDTYFMDDVQKALEQSVTTDNLVKEVDDRINTSKDTAEVQDLIPLRDIVVLTDELALATLNKNT